MTAATVLVTGATDGIGRATALALASTHAHVILHGRNADKLEATLKLAQAAGGAGQLDTVLGDFASLTDVAALAERVAEQFPQLNVLINNAGLLTDHRQLSVDGFELTFAVNYLAPVLLTRKLLATLQRNSPARIVNVASTAMGGGRVDFANLQLQVGFAGWQAYANSKLMNILFSQHLAAQLQGSGVVSNALCPGLIDTNFFHTNTLFASSYERMQPSMRTPEEGALVPLYLAVDPAAERINGEFFVREGRDGRRPVETGLSHELSAQLWQHTDGLLQPWL